MKKPVHCILGVLVAVTPWCGHANPDDGALNPAAARHYVGSDLSNEAIQPGQMFGAAFAVGDFNGDEFDDLAIGVPNLDGSYATGTECGAVIVVPGSWDGLVPAGAITLFTGLTYCQADAHAGSALAAGDFDGDGYDDLAVGAPDQDGNGEASAGAVWIFDGGVNGITGLPQAFTQDSGNVPGVAHVVDHFGSSLAVGKFDNSGYDSLVIGARTDYINAAYQGSITVLHGAPSGLHTGPNQQLATLWSQDSAGIDGVGETYDYYGAALTVCDLNLDGVSDLAIGLPGEDITTPPDFVDDDAGAFGVLYGTSQGLAATAGDVSQNILYTVSPLPDPPSYATHANWFFGTAMVCVERAGPTYELYVGAPGADQLIGPHDLDNGLLEEIKLTPQGPEQDANITRDDGWNAWWAYSTGHKQGTSVVVGRVRRTDAVDVLAGIPGDDEGAGGIVVGIGNPNQRYAAYPADFGLTAQADAGFGQVLAIGNFNGRGPDELVIGTPLWDATWPFTVPDYGMVTVADDTLFADGYD